MANPPPLPPQRPGSPVPALPDAQTYVWLFFRFDGRVGRQVYWLSIFFLSAVIGATGPFVIDPETGSVLFNFGPIQSLVYMVGTICSITVSIKRLHDLGMSGFFAIGLLVFPIAVILSLWLGIRKGDPGPNKYGLAADVRPHQPAPGSPGQDNEE